MYVCVAVNQAARREMLKGKSPHGLPLHAHIYRYVRCTDRGLLLLASWRDWAQRQPLQAFLLTHPVCVGQGAFAELAAADADQMCEGAQHWQAGRVRYAKSYSGQTSAWMPSNQATGSSTPPVARLSVIAHIALATFAHV